MEPFDPRSPESLKDFLLGVDYFILKHEGMVLRDPAGMTTAWNFSILYEYQSRACIAAHLQSDFETFEHSPLRTRAFHFTVAAVILLAAGCSLHLQLTRLMGYFNFMVEQKVSCQLERDPALLAHVNRRRQYFDWGVRWLVDSEVPWLHLTSQEKLGLLDWAIPVAFCANMAQIVGVLAILLNYSCN